MDEMTRLVKTRANIDDLFEKMEQWGCFLRLEDVDKEQLRADFDVLVYKCIDEIQEVLNNQVNRMEL